MKSAGFQAFLRMKVILVLTGGVLLVFLASQGASFFGISRELHKLDDATMAAVNAREGVNVEILNDSIYLPGGPRRHRGGGYGQGGRPPQEPEQHPRTP